MSTALHLNKIANPKFSIEDAVNKLLESRHEHETDFSVLCEVAFNMLDDIEQEDCTESVFDIITQVQMAIGEFAETK